jgi:xylulokinase
VILTLDLGSSVTKVALWDPDADAGLVALAGAPVATDHPGPGRAEQDPAAWWASLVEACGEVRSRCPGPFGAVRVVGCTGARQTLAVVDADAQPLGPAIVWSDRRAADEASRLRGRVGAAPDGPVGPTAPAVTGIPLDAASVAAKLAWLRGHGADRLAAASWVLTPRDLIVAWLTGEVATDPSMASRSGLYLLDGRPDPVLVGDSAGLLAPVLPSDRVTGSLTPSAADALGLTTGTPVVTGAGDRACEVLGSGATESHPMVSWGTTANLSVPMDGVPTPPPAGLVLSRSAGGGWLLEGGLSAAGSLLAWIGRLTGRSPETLAEWAGQSPPGARGVVATPWLEGARAPWWREDAAAGFVGIDSAHGPGDLARAAFEAVAWEVQRCLEVAARRQPSGPDPTGLALGGSGATVGIWTEVLTGVTGLPASARRSGQAASAGAALLAARAVGVECDLDRLDPVDPNLAGRLAGAPVIEAYRALRSRSDRVVAAALGLGCGDGGGLGDADRPGGAVGGAPCR